VHARLGRDLWIKLHKDRPDEPREEDAGLAGQRVATQVDCPLWEVLEAHEPVDRGIQAGQRQRAVGQRQVTEARAACVASKRGVTGWGLINAAGGRSSTWQPFAYLLLACSCRDRARTASCCSPPAAEARDREVSAALPVSQPRHTRGLSAPLPVV
jgi:hypothetical protein